MAYSHRTKSQLVAELEAMSERMATLEGLPQGERRSNYLLRIFIDAIPQFGLSVDQSGRILQVINGGQKSESQVLNGRLLSDILPQVDVEKLREGLRETFRTGDEQQFEFILSVMAGRRWYRVRTGLAKTDNSDTPLGVLLFQDVTNEKLAESVLEFTQQELQQQRQVNEDSDARFHSLMDRSIQGIIVHRNREPLYVNAAFARIFGYETAEEVCQPGVFKRMFLPEEDARMDRDQDERRGGASRDQHYQTRARKKDGSTFWVEYAVFKTGWEGESALWVTCVDITERKRVEERLQAFVRYSPSTVVIYDIEMNLVEFNKMSEEILGLNREEVIGKNIADVFPDAVAEGRAESYSQVAKSGNIFRAEFWKRYPSEGDRCFQTTAFPMGDDVAVVGVDITERKRAEEELRASQRLLRTVFDTIPHSLFVRDINSNYLMVNRALASRYGMQPEDFARVHLLDIPVGTAEQRQEFLKSDRQVLETGLPATNEKFPFLQSDGETRYFSNSVLPLHGDEGEVVGLVGIAEDVTDRVRAEEDLRASQRLMREVIDAIPFHLFLKDLNDRFLMVNRNFGEYWGMDPEHPEDFSLSTLPREEDDLKEFFLETDRKLLETGQMVDEIFQFKRSDGSEIFRRHIKVPHRDHSGDIVGIIGLSVDISDQTQAEEELRENAALLKTVFESAPVGMIVKDLNLRFMMVNKAVRDLAGMSESEMITQNAQTLGLATAEEREAVESADRRVLESGETEDIPELEYTFPAVGRRLSHVIKSPLFGDDGGIIGLVSIWEDITDRKQALEDLQASEARFQQFAQISADWMWETDAQLRFTWISQDVDLVSGIPANSIYGKTREELIGDDFDRDMWNEHLETLKAHKSFRNFEFRHDLIPTQARWISTSGAPVFDSEDHFKGYRGVATDITQRKALEMQLREAQKMEAVGQLAGGIAHDFNNTMQIIIYSANIARTSLHDPAQLDSYLETILNAGERTADLTRQLLAFSRQSMIQPKPVDFNRLVSNIMRMVGRLIGEQIELDMRLGSDLHAVTADQGTMEQVILNLCVNARDAMPDGGRLIVETGNFEANRQFRENHELTHGGGYVLLSISDDGVGMPAEVRDRVFEPFFTTKDVGEGTGLGLAMAYGIVRQHEGVIEVVSEPGVGSTFNIYLPATASTETVAEQRDISQAPGGAETILIAEDEDDVRTLMSDVLQRKGYRVLAARDGAAALEVFETHQEDIELLILDMVMPNMGGRELFDRISAIRPGIPVLFTTGYATTAADAEFLSQSGLPLIQKPYSPDKLLGTMREILSQNKS